MNHSFLAYTVFIILFITSSCGKEKTTNPVAETKNGNLSFSFKYVFNNEVWKLGSTVVQQKTNDTLTFTTFKFYISNIKLKNADGTWWIQPESYYLVDASSSSTFTVKNVPTGNYVAMEYTMGVDSLRNVSGAQNGDLSLTKGMYWDWNSGYIMLKAEGRSPQSPTGTFAIHPGGFFGENNIVTVKNANFEGKDLVIASDKNSTIKMVADPSALWYTPTSVKDRSTVHEPGSDAKQVANDFYTHGITFGGIVE